MPTYSEPAEDYEWGYSGLWNTAQSSVDVQYTADSGLAFIKFGDLTDILSGVTVTSATLHLSFSLVSGTAVVHVYGGKTDPPALPGGSGWSGAYTIWQDYRSSANPSFDADGLTSYDLDVGDLIAELVSGTEGDDIVLMLVQPMYSGASVVGVTATLEIVYAGDDAFITVDQPEGAIELEGAACSAEVHVNATQPAGAIELQGSTPTAVTVVLVDQPAGTIELAGSTPTAITNLAVTQPTGFIELEGAACSAETAVNVTQPAGSIELVGSTSNAVTVVFADQPAGSIELVGGSCSAVTTVIVSQPQATIELAGSTHTAVVPPIATQPAGAIELVGGRHWVTPSWKTVTLGSVTFATGGAK